MEMFNIKNVFKQQIKLIYLKTFLIFIIVCLILTNSIPAIQNYEDILNSSPVALQSNNVLCIVIYPNGGEEIWDTVTVQWEVYNISSYTLYSKVFLGGLSSDYIKTDNGVHRYSFNSLKLSDGRYKVIVRCYVDINEDNIPEKFVGSDESDDFFYIINGPRTPEKPTGITNGRPDIEYFFSSSSTHHAKKQLKYKFSWGDGLYSSWLGPYNSGEIVTATHSWGSTGEYTVKVKVQDSSMKASDWSTGLNVNIYNNNPDVPSIIGPEEGKIGKNYSFKIKSFDKDEDKVYYIIDWEDGHITEWSGPYDSGESISFTHCYQNNGSYTIKVKTKDIYDAESDWGSHIIKMSKTKSKIDAIQFFNNILDRKLLFFNSIFLNVYNLSFYQLKLT